MMRHLHSFLVISAFTSLGLVLGQSLIRQPVNQLQAMEPQPVTLRFAGKVGNQHFQCGESYSLGRPATMMTPTDFRFYVTDVALIDAAGRAVPVTLQQDGKWQYQSVALLDFENKEAACANGTTDVRDRIVGTVPAGTYRGIRFKLGVPFALNHADATLAPSPLNLTSLWWNWRGGYKFLRIDLISATLPDAMRPGGRPRQLTHSPAPQHTSPGHSAPSPHEQSPGFAIHLGSTACQAATNMQAPTRCANPNLAEVTLNNFNPAQNVIVADLAALVASTNLTMNQPNTPSGCMASPEDRDCTGIMHNVGLAFGGQPSTGQTFFRVE